MMKLLLWVLAPCRFYVDANVPKERNCSHLQGRVEILQFQGGEDDIVLLDFCVV
jgi:hypothetical protein